MQPATHVASPAQFDTHVAASEQSVQLTWFVLQAPVAPMVSLPHWKHAPPSGGVTKVAAQVQRFGAWPPVLEVVDEELLDEVVVALPPPLRAFGMSFLMPGKRSESTAQPITATTAGRVAPAQRTKIRFTSRILGIVGL